MRRSTSREWISIGESDEARSARADGAESVPGSAQGRPTATCMTTRSLRQTELSRGMCRSPWGASQAMSLSTIVPLTTDTSAAQITERAPRIEPAKVRLPDGFKGKQPEPSRSRSSRRACGPSTSDDADFFLELLPGPAVPTGCPRASTSGRSASRRPTPRRPSRSASSSARAAAASRPWSKRVFCPGFLSPSSPSTSKRPKTRPKPGCSRG